MRATLALHALWAMACGPADSPNTPISTPDSGVEDSGTPPVDDAQITGSCAYVNPFSQSDECKEYGGAGWSDATAADDCAAPMVGAGPGTYASSVACDRVDILGTCAVEGDDDTDYTLVFPGDDPGDCASVELGCGFAGGSFVGEGVCDGQTSDPNPSDDSVFQPFEQICVPPVDGEPPGNGPDGDVCTWQAISGATEEGRHFADYADCSTVLSQRPYWAMDVQSDTAADDPRLSDPEWAAELAWVTSQVESSACVCCHSADLAPDGPSGWYLEADPIWIDTVDDDGLAMLAGWVDSTAFGAFDAEDNNGFDRSTTGLPTTDIARMRAFLEGELNRRGFGPDDFADTAPFGGPLYDQLTYTPEACADGQGVDANGTVNWTGGAARYVYVLEPGGLNPGVPPNLDLPEETRWRLDVDWTETPIESGLRYGDTPPGTAQAWPIDGAPAPLESGEQLHLYVLRDVYQPLTRCLFTVP